MEGEAGSMHREPDMGLDPGSPGLRPGPEAGAKLLRHPGIPSGNILKAIFISEQLGSKHSGSHVLNRRAVTWALLFPV